MGRITRFAAALGLALAATAATAQSTGPRRDQLEFRGLYKELIETNTTLSVGSCTLASERMAARLKAAGYPDKDVRILIPDGRPKDGNLIAVLPGTDAKLPAILLLAHIDVVEANREDWERDPFTLIEENGYFYARGAIDDKSMAAIFTDSLIRYRKEGFKPKRTIKLALTCGEETSATHNGVQWLLEKHPDALAAGFALNEGGRGRITADGKPIFLELMAAEKIYQDYTLEITNPGGHSSRPFKDNAIVRLSAALTRIGAHDFPVDLIEAVKLNFLEAAKTEPPETAKALRGVVANPNDELSVTYLSKDAGRNAMMRTTCVPTMVTAGHANNALPQRARANVNCRILPGQTPQQTLETLRKVIADDGITITLAARSDVLAVPPPLTDEILGPARKVAAKIWPGVPLIPTMTTGATDGRFTTAAGIPTYGLSGLLVDIDGGGTHGLNERVRVKSLYDARDFLHELVRLYTK